MIRANQVKVPVGSNEAEVKNALIKKYRLSDRDLNYFKIFRESIDARKGRIQMSYTVDFTTGFDDKLLKKFKDLATTKNMKYKYPERKNMNKKRPIVIGFGPAGMFSALLLAEMGMKPIVLERGEAVDERTLSVEKFWKTGVLNPNSNVQFGEGGAGTFSDGKLTTRIKDLRARKVLEYLVEFGAPESILIKQKPHIGTDILKVVVKNLREKIIALGGEVRFNNDVTDLIIGHGLIEGVIVNGERLMGDHVVLAIGHSSRKMFEHLHESGIGLTPKPFAVGVRIEHKQSLINKSQYGDESLANVLGAAEYKLTHTTEKGRGVYSFCMCPGGFVVASSSEEGGVVTNGMSEYKRNQANANSALLVSVTPEDFDGDHPLKGMYFQRSLEQKAYLMGGSNYFAPMMTVGAFLKGEFKMGEVEASYKPGVSYTNFFELFPGFINESLVSALKYFDKRIKGFASDDAIMTAVESRSSSPVRINRDQETLESVNVAGLYPCGEGAGYAGGIVSSAVDGLRVAEKIIESE